MSQAAGKTSRSFSRSEEAQFSQGTLAGEAQLVVIRPLSTGNARIRKLLALRGK